MTRIRAREIDTQMKTQGKAGDTLSTAGAATLPLREWLALHRRADAGARRLRIGACGHLMLSPTEARRVRRQLTDVVLPSLVADGATRLSLFVGMAPGADMLFLDTAATWLRERNLPFEMTALLPVPIGSLVNDWVLRAQDDQRTVSRKLRSMLGDEIEALLQRCTTIVPLYPEDIDATTLGSRAFRQRQYRQLGAVLAQHADHVVAILRPSATVEPGGTAEIVAWRRARERIPADLRLHASHCADDDHVHLIDPARQGDASTPAAAPDRDDALAQTLQRAEFARRAGNELACHDIVQRALHSGLRSRQLDALRIQALANTGNVRLALDRYRSLDLHDDELDEDWLALHGRLEKDLALLGDGGPDQFARAASAYEQAHARYGGSYSAINAASMRMLAGERRRAHAHARRALACLKPGRDAVARFYALATRAEAALLFDDPKASRTHLAAANRLLRDDVTRRGRTRQQLRSLCLQLGHDPSLVEALRVPPLLQLRTPPAARDDADTTLPPSLRRIVAERALLHLPLCTPFDLRLCEQLVAHGAHLYLSLPSLPAELARQWRRRAPGAAHRLQRVLDAADGVAMLQGFLAGESAWAAHEAAATSHGLAQLSARRLGQPLQVFDCAGDTRLRCRRAIPKAPRAAAIAPPGRRMAGLIFADFASFRRLREPLFPRYYAEVMQALAVLLGQHRQRILVRKTWGDALHVVTEDAHTAAQIVAGIQHVIESRRLHDDGVLGDLELRIAAHYAPSYVGFDPIEETTTHYGTQLSFAARIEPVVPPGMIYVTESFAAQLTLEAPAGFQLDYAGEVDFAKQFGTYRLYALRQRVPVAR